MIESITAFQKFSALEALEYTQFKHMYVDICDDLVAGILLSKIVYWFSPSKKNHHSRCQAEYKGRKCLVKQRADWWDECRISVKQFDRVKLILEKLGFISVETHKSEFHKYETASFIFMNEDVFMKAVNDYINQKTQDNSKKDERVIPELPKREFRDPDISSDCDRGEFQSSPKGNSRDDQKGTPYTISMTTDNDYLLSVTAGGAAVLERQDQEKDFSEEDTSSEETDLPNQITITTTGNRKLQVTQSDIYAYVVGQKIECTTEAIRYAWKALCECDCIIHDWQRFISGTINNYKNKKRSVNISKAKQKDITDGEIEREVERIKKQQGLDKPKENNSDNTPTLGDILKQKGLMR